MRSDLLSLRPLHITDPFMRKFKEWHNTKNMKTILILIITIFSVLNLNAKCAWNGLFVFPSGKTIKQNSIIVIDGYAASQDVVKGLNKKFPVYLVNGKHKIKLKIKEVLVGQFRLTQAVLVPETNLTVGLEYTLVIDNLPNDESLDRWNSELKKSEPIVYAVVQGLDNTKPAFSATPKEIKKSLIYYGCGPSIHVVFDCNVTDSSEYLIKATVKSLKSGNETSYYVEPVKGNLNIGHGMCSGAFNFDEGDDYEIEFSIMDESGNMTAWTGDRIKFTKPTYKNSNNDDK